MKPKFNRHILPSAAFVVMTSPAFAATWIGTDNLANNFNTAGNWNPAAVPANTTDVIIGTGATVNVNGGLNRAANTTLDGSLTISGNLNNNNGTNTNSALTVNSGASFTQTGGNYFVGAANGGTGTTTFTQAGGTVNVTALRGFQASDGSGATFAGRTGTYNINGGTFTATVANDTIAEIYNGFLAGRAGGTTPDSFNVAGGTATFQVPVTALARRFTLTNGASVNVSSGSLAFNGFAENRLGYDDGNIAGASGAPANAAASKVTVSGTGALTFAMAGTNPFFDVGATPGYNGLIEVTGGTLNITGGGLSIGSSGANGSVTLSNGALTVGNFINIGRKDSNTSGGTEVHLNLNGGTLSTSSIRSGGGTTDATNSNVVANGGSIKALADEPDFLRIGVNGATNLNNDRPYVKIESGGLTFDTNSHTVGIQTGLHTGTTIGGGLTKIGSGTLSLSGTNDYTGATNVNNGTLKLVPAGSFAGACNVATGAALAASGNVSDVWTLPDLNFSNGSSFSIANFDPQVFSGPAVAVTNSLVPSGTVTVNISGSLSPNSNYSLISYGTLGGGGFSSFQLGSLPRGTVANLTNVSGVIGLHVGVANSLKWKGNVSSTWDINTTSNWTLGGSPDKYLENDNVRFDDTANVGSTTIALNSVVAPTSLVFDHTTKNYTIGGTGSITGSTTLNKLGDGMLTLATANTYTGITTVNAGTLRFGDGVTDGSLAGPLLVNDMNVIFNTTGTATLSGTLDGYSASGTSLTKIGTGTQIFTGTANTYAGPVQINGGTFQIGNGAVNGSFGFSSTYQIAANGQLRLNYATASSPTWSSVSGAGVLSLASTPSFDWGNVSLLPEFTGTLRVEKGRVGFNGIGSPGGASKIQILSGAQLLAFSSVDPYTTPIEIAGTGWGEGGYPNGLRLAGSATATWAGGVTLTADSGIMAQRLANFTVTGSITGPFQCEFYVGDPAGDSGTLNVAPATALQNSYGSTKINGRPNGSTVAGNAYAFSSGPLVVAESILKLNGFNFTFANLSGTGGKIGNFHAANPSVITVGGDNSSTSYTGVIVDGGAAPLGIVKTGTGTLSLTGANSYTGNTTVTQGTLSIASPTLADTSTVSIASGAHLDLSTGAADTVGVLILGGVTVPSGTYNSSHPVYGSYFTGTGSLVIAGGYSSWATAKGLDATNNGLSQDPDNDGMKNLLEFYLDGNPLASDSTPLFTQTNDATYLTLTFHRRDDANGDLTSQVAQYGSNLTGWTDVALGSVSTGPDANGVFVDVVGNDTAPDAISVRIPKANAVGGKLFGRLKVAK